MGLHLDNEPQRLLPHRQDRKHGVADALLAAVVEWATVRAETLRPHVYEYAEPARRFYARNGFVPTGRTQPVYVRGSQPQPTAGSVLEFSRDPEVRRLGLGSR